MHTNTPMCRLKNVCTHIFLFHFFFYLFYSYFFVIVSMLPFQQSDCQVVLYYCLGECLSAGDAIICRHILCLHGDQEQGEEWPDGRGSNLMSRIHRLTEPLVSPWEETMAGREWAALQALCALYRCVSLSFVFSVSFCQCVFPPHILSLSHAHTHAHTHIHQTLGWPGLSARKQRGQWKQKQDVRENVSDQTHLMWIP